MAFTLLLSLASGGSVAPPSLVAAGLVDTPKQQAGTAKGRPHQATSNQTAAKPDRKSRTPRRPKGAPELEKKFTPKVVSKTDAKRPAPPKTAAAKVMPKHEPVKVTGFDPKKSVEDPTQRTRFTNRYRNPDGTWTAQVSTRPVNYQAPDGTWQPVDSTLVADGKERWRNRADQQSVTLAARASGQDLTTLDLGKEQKFAFGVNGAQAVQGRVQGNSITYAGVRPDADLQLTVLDGGSVKEQITLRSPNAPTEWEFPLRAENLTPRMAPDGSVELLDKGGQVAGRIPHGFMVDSKIDPRSGDSARSEAVTYGLQQRGDTWVLKVSADPSWVQDPARVFPVVVDPTTVWNYSDTHDTYVQTGYGSSPYAENELKAGTYDGGSTKAATYLAFTQVDNDLAHSKIYDVDLYMYNYWSYSCKATPVTVYGVTKAWSQSDLAAYPGPKYGSALASKSYAHGWTDGSGAASPCPADWEGMDLGSAGNALVQGWVDGSKPNYGLTVRGSTSSSYGWKKFSSRETGGGPYLKITYSPFNAWYAFADSPPKIDPPVLNNSAGNVKVKVQNRGHDAWNTSDYKLTYEAFDSSGRQIYHKAAQTALPQAVSFGETVTVNAKINPLPPGTWTIKFDMIKTTSDGYALFSDWGVPRTAALKVTVPDVPTQLTEMFPKNNYETGTLQPQLFAEAKSVDAWPSANVNYQFTLCAPPWIDWDWCVNSPWQQTPKWTVPAGKLAWGKEYYWTVSVNDGGGSTTNGPWYKMVTGVPQPAITSHLASPASDGQQFDQQAGNYTTTATDAQVATVGPPLSISRTYNSLDPRTDGLFGAGWSTRYDMKVVPDNDGTGNVVVTYPGGQEVRFAKDASGDTYTAPAGTFATLSNVLGGGWKLRDKTSTTYKFGSGGKLDTITDNRGRSENLTYGLTGHLDKVTASNGRSLTFTWDFWNANHVLSVSTDPVDGNPLTWNYTYDGDSLTKVCPPGTTTECTQYSYTAGSHYQTVVRDDNPTGYWRFNESSGTVMHSSVPENLGTDAAGGVNVVLGQDGALAGTSDQSTAFSGLASRVRLPDRYISREGGYLSVEAWFRTIGTGVILSYQNAIYGGIATKFTPAVYVGTDNKLHGQFWNGSAANVMSSPNQVTDDKWHHVVLSGQGGSQSLYLDGQAVGTLSGTIDHGNAPFVIVGSGYTSPSWPHTSLSNTWWDFSGEIDEVAIYDKPLGLPTIKQHYAARLASQQLQKVTSPGGRVQAVNTYNTGTDRLSQHTDDKGGTWKISAPTFSGKIDDLQRTITLTGPNQASSTYVYEPLRGNRLLSETDQLGKTTTYGYDVDGHLGQITDANGNVTNLWFDERGNKRYEQRCSDPDTCHAEYWTYYLNADDPFDPRNDQLTEYNDGRTLNPYDTPYYTTWQYDQYGQQTDEIWAATDAYSLRGVQYQYTDGTETAEGGGTQPAGLLKRRGKANGGTSATYSYTAAGDLAKITDAAGKVTTYAYDALGRVTSATETTDAQPGGVTTTYGYDGQGRLIRQIGPGVTNQTTNVVHTAETRLTYDADGHTLTQTLADLTGGDPERTTTYTYNDHGLPETVTDPEGGQQTYGYDVTGARTSVTDERGTKYTFAYTLRGELATRTLKDWTGNPNDPSPATDKVLDSYAYDPGGRLASHTDAMGRTLAYTYYGDDRLAQTTAQGAKINGSATPQDLVLDSRAYDGAGHLTSETVGGTQRTDYEYDETGHLIATIVDPDGAARRTDYGLDPDNNITRTVRTGADSEGEETTTYAYDPMNLPVRMTVENGDNDLVTTYTRDQRGLVTQIVDPRGNAEGATPADYTTTLHYDNAGQLTQVLQPPVQVEQNGQPATTDRPTLQYGYNNAGEQTQATNPLGQLTTIAYDKTGRQTSIARPAYTPPGGTQITPTTTLHYDPAGQLTESTDARGNTTRLTYDALGNPVRLEEPELDGESGPGTWRAEYDLTGEQLSLTNPVGARTEATYDDLGNQITTTRIDRYPTPAAFTSHYAYDGAGNLISRTRPAGDSVSYTYDDAGALTAVTDRTQHTSTLDYDFTGRLTKITDPRGASTTAEYDPAGRMTRVQDLDPSGTVLRTFGYGYDAAGNRTSETTPEGHTTHRAYDAARRLTTLTEPTSATATIQTTFGYDAAGQQTRLTDGRGNATITTYNTLGLPEKVIEPRTSTAYDDASRTWTTSYDATGNPVRQDKPGAVSITRTFDELGRLTKQSGTGGSVNTPDTRFGYDLAGNRIQVSAPDNDTLITYNDRGLPLTSTSHGDKTTQFSYDPNGRLTQQTDPAGTTTLTWNGDDQIATTTDSITGDTDTRTYDDAGRLTGIATLNGTTTAHRTYGYDDLDRLTSDELKAPDGTSLASIGYGYNLDDQLTTKTTTGTTGAGTNTYGYDDAGRLTSWTDPTGHKTDYGWDPSGNRIQAGATTYTYDERNRLTSDGTNTYTYSARGTLKSDGTNTLTWDAFDRLITDHGVRYAYDGLNRIATRTQGANTDTFLYATDQNDLTAILDGSGDLESSYQRTPDGSLLSTHQNGQSYRAYSDRHDDLTALTDATVTTLTGSTAYDPFGGQAGTTGTTSLIGYQGEYAEPETGRVNMNARWYTPGTANFTTRDTWTLDPDPSIQANRYTYVDADPLDGTDPTGHLDFPIPVPSIGIGAEVGTEVGVEVGPYGWAALGLGYAGYGAYLAAPYYGRAMGGLMAPGFSGLAPGMNMALPYTGCMFCGIGGGSGYAGGSGQGGTGAIGSRPAPPPRPTPAQIQKKQAEWARDHPKPRPPIVNTVSQRDVDRQRNSIESGVKAAAGVNSVGSLLSGIGNFNFQSARPAAPSIVDTPAIPRTGSGTIFPGQAGLDAPQILPTPASKVVETGTQFIPSPVSGPGLVGTPADSPSGPNIMAAFPRFTVDGNGIVTETPRFVAEPGGPIDDRTVSPVTLNK
ncbi:DNRLRE domain-containing protein [Actinomadura sp. LD22]|uniref:DNRLRE domain-containing protein n=1 Tax=Actinomadura physcomitrii TaxID=2650748 RepID=A0A6I4MN84_9ACTN|nr:DNRLRE domain-containing protein [Actinomadura physcomitrii]MWA05377.1 DNRLRE domain-containing protein [Actinomadura physcomitrii]